MEIFPIFFCVIFPLCSLNLPIFSYISRLHFLLRLHCFSPGFLPAEDPHDRVIQRRTAAQTPESTPVAFARSPFRRSRRSPTSADTGCPQCGNPRTEPGRRAFGDLHCQHDVGFRRRLFREAAETYLSVNFPEKRAARCHRGRFRPGRYVLQRWSKSE